MATAYIIINGTQMSEEQYKAYRKSLQPKVRTTSHRPQPQVVTPRQYVAIGVNNIMKDIRVVDSLLAYSRNGYKQWGNEHTMIMNLKEISSPYTKFMVAARKLIETTDKIERYARRGTKQLPSLLEEMGWHLQDTQEALTKLVGGIKKSEVLYGLQHSKAIKENGRRLGLSELTSRSETALRKMTEAMTDLKTLAEDL